MAVCPGALQDTEETEEGGETRERDVYDTMLTQAEIQEGVDDVNTMVKKQEAEARSKSY